MIFDSAPVDAGQFLQEYWQRRPLLLRQAFPAFEPELDDGDIVELHMH